MILLLSGLLLWLAYAWLIGFYRRGWKTAVAAAAEPVGAGDSPFLSVLVPARNEAHNLPRLFEALRMQTYPAGRFEVVLLDDHSEDRTTRIATAYGGNVRVHTLPEGVAGKKAAIAFGVAAARGPWIVTTDADCLPGPRWLEQLAAASPDSEFIAAPVRYRGIESLCDRFQALDFLTLQGITAASVATGFHSMCNGANLAYSKAAFLAVDGFAGVDHIASGDDLLLMHKIVQRYPGRVHYRMHPDAIVETEPAPGWIAFWKQRVRWASKSAEYDDKRIFWALLLVFGLNAWFFVAAACCFFDARQVWTLLLVLLLKTLVEIRFLGPVARFFGQTRLLKWFLPLQPLHIVYTVLVGLLSQVGSYEWKGRRVK